MILYYLLFVEGLLKSTYKDGSVFYQEKPPAVASAKGEEKAKEYIGQIEKKLCL